MVPSLLFEVALVFLIGIGSQWLAWRYRLPAIVVMSITGLLAGPIFGMIDPSENFGSLYNPLISVAVAIILFEGSLNLNFKELRGIGKPVFRISTLGAFIAWILGSLTAHYVAGLSWAVSFVIGGLLIVTGPTVIMPMLRQSNLKPRPARILKWEGIVVDPIGPLLAVFALEIVMFVTADSPNLGQLLIFFAAAIFAAILGWFVAKGTGWLFERGLVPDFLKSSMVIVIVIFSFTIADMIMHETGLLTVTAMGITLANSNLSSLSEIKHFKENISVLLISTVFIMLTASLERETLIQIFSPNIIFYVILMMFVVRPLSIFLSTIKTGLSLQEKTLLGWIAPRGIVALTVSGYFATVLQDAGYEDASVLTALTFALVLATVVAHGFSLGWISDKLNLSRDGKPGTLIVGSNRFTVQLAKSLQQAKRPVIIVDDSWEDLSKARHAGVPFYHGSLLDEQTEFNLDTSPYDYLLSITEDSAYNSLICTTFTPEYGRHNVFKVSPFTETTGAPPKGARSKVGGRVLFNWQFNVEELKKKLDKGFIFRSTLLTDKYTFNQYIADKDGQTVFLYLIRPSGELKFFSEEMRTVPAKGDKIVSLTPPNKEKEKAEKKLEKQQNANG